TPLDTSAMQTTATNSATYLVNNRRRVFATEAVTGACGEASVAVAASGRVEADKYLAKSRALMANTVSNVGPPCPPSLRDVAPSFDHLTRPCEQYRRPVESQRVGSLQVDHQFELGRRLHGKIAGIGALQDPVDIGCRAAEEVGGITTIRNQTAAL